MGDVQVQGSPFVIKAFDVSKVNVTNVANGFVGKPGESDWLHVRGHYQIDVYSCHSKLISPEIFKQLGPYESPEYALSNEVW